MSSSNSIVLIIWVNDNPITGTIFNSKSIIEPKDIIPKVGNYVTVRFPGFGRQRGIVGKIGDESMRSSFKDILKGDEFLTLVDTVCKSKKAEQGKKKEKALVPPPPPPPPPAVVNNNIRSDICEMAQQEKKKLAGVKRQREKARCSANGTTTLGLLPPPPAAAAATSAVWKDIFEMVKELQAGQQSIKQQLDGFAQCKSCIKAVYKTLKPQPASLAIPLSSLGLLSIPPSASLPSPPSASLSSPTFASISSPPSASLSDSSPPALFPSTTFASNSSSPSLPLFTYPSTPSRAIPSKRSTHLSPSSFSVSPSASPSSPPPTNVENACQEDEADSNEDEMMYMGDSKYGVRVSKRRMQQCQMFANSCDKLAKALLELLVTKEDCDKHLTIYGFAKGKNALDENKRKALKSHIFSVYPCSNLEKRNEVWDTIVKKLNDKIRGIRNNKYKSF
ncbi:uncharacterized protein [Antedon mediterranea]|uniref:uncharacterized protein n=1 Tax=Antedon mediterranea TaxID=105859 RepID=UPI003AF5B599